MLPECFTLEQYTSEQNNHLKKKCSKCCETCITYHTGSKHCPTRTYLLADSNIHLVYNTMWTDLGTNMYALCKTPFYQICIALDCPCQNSARRAMQWRLCFSLFMKKIHLWYRKQFLYSERFYLHVCFHIGEFHLFAGKENRFIISADSCLLMHAFRSAIHMSSNHAEMTQVLVFQPQGKCLLHL